MPWHIEKRNGRFCVIKDDDGENEGCHDTEKKAESQMRALYASEGKMSKAIVEDEFDGIEDDELEKAKWSTSYVNNLPDSSFLYIESGGEKDSEGKTTPRSLRHLPVKDAEGNYDAAHLRNAIARASQIKLKDGSTISSSKASSLQGKARSALERIQKALSYYDLTYYDIEATDFDELDSMKQALEVSMEIRELMDAFLVLCRRALYRYDPEVSVGERVARVYTLVSQLDTRIQMARQGISKSWEVGIVAKALDDDKHLVYGVVLAPDIPDAQDDIITSDEIEKAAHKWMLDSQKYDNRHIKVFEDGEAQPVETYIAPVDMHINGGLIKKGSWVLVTYVPDEEVWSDIKKGQLMSYSILGWGKRTPATV